MSLAVQALALVLLHQAESSAPMVPTLAGHEVVAQETAFWCWAASAQMVSARFGLRDRRHTQARQAEHLLERKGKEVSGRCTPNCRKGLALPEECNTTGFPDFEELGLGATLFYGYPERMEPAAGRLPWSVLERELRCRPVAFAYHNGDPIRTGKIGSGHMVVFNSANVSYPKGESKVWAAMNLSPVRWLEVYDPSPVRRTNGQCLADRRVMLYKEYLKVVPWRTYYQFRYADKPYEPCDVESGPRRPDPDESIGFSTIEPLPSAEVLIFQGEAIEAVPTAASAEDAVRGFLPSLTKTQSSLFSVDESPWYEDGPDESALWLREAAGIPQDEPFDCDLDRPVVLENLALDRLTETENLRLDELVTSTRRMRFLCTHSEEGAFSIETVEEGARWHVSAVGSTNLSGAIAHAIESSSSEESVREVHVPGFSVRFLRFRADDGTSRVYPLSPMVGHELTYDEEGDPEIVDEETIVRALREVAERFEAHGPS